MPKGGSVSTITGVADMFYDLGSAVVEIGGEFFEWLGEKISDLWERTRWAYMDNKYIEILLSDPNIRAMQIIECIKIPCDDIEDEQACAKLEQAKLKLKQAENDEEKRKIVKKLLRKLVKSDYDMLWMLRDFPFEKLNETTIDKLIEYSRKIQNLPEILDYYGGNIESVLAEYPKTPLQYLKKIELDRHRVGYTLCNPNIDEEIFNKIAEYVKQDKSFLNYVGSIHHKNLRRLLDRFEAEDCIKDVYMALACNFQCINDENYIYIYNHIKKSLSNESTGGDIEIYQEIVEKMEETLNKNFKEPNENVKESIEELASKIRLFNGSIGNEEGEEKEGSSEFTQTNYKFYKLTSPEDNNMNGPDNDGREPEL